MGICFLFFNEFFVSKFSFGFFFFNFKFEDAQNEFRGVIFSQNIGEGGGVCK